MKPQNVSVSTVQISPNELYVNIIFKLPGVLARDGDKVSEKSRKDSQKSFKKILEGVEFPNIGSVQKDENV